MMLLRNVASAVFLSLSLALSPSFAATVDGEPTLNPGSDSGLYVWRTSGGNWQARFLASSNATQRFAGVFTAGQTITLDQRIALETADGAHVGPNNTLHVDLNVAGADVDGVSFTVAFNGSLCLNNNGVARRVYIGANATPATTPVSLHGADACASGSSAAGDGLYLNHVGNNSWEVRQLSETSPQHFSGVLEATQALLSFQQVSLESEDNAYKSAADTVTMNLNSWPGGHDGFDFQLPPGAGACLRDLATPGSVVFFGSGPTDAIPVVTPVDLTNSGACSNVPGDTPGTRKFNSGHYVALMRGNDSQATMSASIGHGVKGFMKRYTWQSLEPTMGTYDFSEIASDLAYLAGRGKQLVVMIEDKTFVDERPTPQYLWGNTKRNKPGGWTAIRWNPFVVTRMKALATALGNRFDSHPNFEGIATQESAPGFSRATLDSAGYTPELYRAALIDYLTSATVSMPTSRVFWFMNYLPRNQGYLADIASAVANTGVIMGGPDVMPDNWALQEHTYPLYRQFDGQMPLFGQVEPVCYSHQHADTNSSTQYWTMTELFLYARNNLKTDYMFWVNYPNAQFNNSYDFYDALPVISQYAGYGN